jgi:hypothetical protein
LNENIPGTELSKEVHIQLRPKVPASLCKLLLDSLGELLQWSDSQPPPPLSALDSLSVSPKAKSLNIVLKFPHILQVHRENEKFQFLS